MLKYINGKPSATNCYKNLYWEGYFTEEPALVLDKILANNISEIRGQYSLLYIDDQVTPGVSLNLGYPLYTNGIDYSNDPLDFGATLDESKVNNLLRKHNEQLAVLDLEDYCVFTKCKLILPTEKITAKEYTTNDIVKQFLNTIRIATQNCSVGIMFGDGWDSHCLLSACQKIGIDPTLVYVKSKQQTRVKELGKYVILKPNPCIEVTDYSLHHNLNFTIQHRYMIQEPLEFDVILRGNDAEIYSMNSMLYQKSGNIKKVIPNNTTRNSIFELNTNNKWVDPFINTNITSSILAGNLSLKDKSLQKNICTNHSLVISNSISDIIEAKTYSTIIMQNLKYLQSIPNLSNHIKEAATIESGLWLNTIRNIMDRYI